jgi:hypothetical protein
VVAITGIFFIVSAAVLVRGCRFAVAVWFAIVMTALRDLAPAEELTGFLAEHFKAPGLIAQMHPAFGAARTTEFPRSEFEESHESGSVLEEQR